MRTHLIMNKLFLCGIGVVAGLISASAGAGDIYVIAHPSVTLGDERQLREVYMGEKQFAGSLKVVPVENMGAQTDFLEKVIGMRPDKYAALWVKKSFRGNASVPPTKSDDEDVIKFVKNTPGAIGYVSTPKHGLKELFQY